MPTANFLNLPCINFGGGESPDIYTDKKRRLSDRFFDQILNWRFTIPQREGILDIENIGVNH